MVSVGYSSMSLPLALPFRGPLMAISDQAQAPLFVNFEIRNGDLTGYVSLR
jgi:hypothetical protein